VKMMIPLNQNESLARFASCVRAGSLLHILLEAVRYGRVGKVPLIFPAGDNVYGNFTPGPAGQDNLTRCEIFRGKIPQRGTRTNINRLEERTLPAPHP